MMISPPKIGKIPSKCLDRGGADRQGRENAMRRRILYVEDDPTGREVALFNLRRAGYDVTPASDGQEALSCFSLEKFDLVITDIRMPGISGLELVRRKWGVAGVVTLGGSSIYPVGPVEDVVPAIAKRKGI